MKKIAELKNPASDLNKAGDDEVLFVLRGTDPAFPAAVEAWINERVVLGLNDTEDCSLVLARNLVCEAMTPSLLFEIAKGQIFIALGEFGKHFNVKFESELSFQVGEFVTIGVNLDFELGNTKKTFYLIIGWRDFDELGLELGEDGDIYPICSSLIHTLIVDLLTENEKNIEHQF